LWENIIIQVADPMRYLKEGDSLKETKWSQRHGSVRYRHFSRQWLNGIGFIVIVNLLLLSL
jgi:hypothetical protein